MPRTLIRGGAIRDGAVERVDLSAELNAYLEEVPRINAPSGIATLKEITNIQWSAGALSGFAASDNGDGTVAIADGEILLRSSASETAPLYLIKMAATASVALTDASVNFIYVDYASGTPALAVTTSVTGFNCLDKCILAVVSREGTHLHILDGTRQNVDSNRKLRRRYLEAEPFKWVPGGTMLGASGLAVTLTAGKFWFALEPMTHGAFDTSVAGSGHDREFSTYYRNGSGGWTKATGVKTVNNTQYDDGDGTLATAANGRYLVHWIYLAMGQDPHMAVLYSQAQYNTVAAAQASKSPASVPHVFTGTTILVGRLIVLKNAATVALVESTFLTAFSAGSPSVHNNLSGLNDADYQHLTASQLAVVVNLAGALGNYADDAAAATGGVLAGQFYRNGSAVMVRVA